MFYVLHKGFCESISRVSKTFSQSKNFSKIKKKYLQLLSNPSPNLLALGKKNHPYMQIYTLAYHRANRMWRRKNRIGFLMQMYKRERNYKSGWCDLEII
jgi:hypothetical protein